MMADQPRFLLGFGERLTAPVPGPSSSPPPGPTYSFEEAVQRLLPEAITLSSDLAALPADACPDNEAVSVVTLHPQSIAKSYHPKKLFDQYNLRQIGSRPKPVKPDRWTKQSEPEESPSTELYVAGDRTQFMRWRMDFQTQPGRINEAIQRIEHLHVPVPSERMRHLENAQRTEGGMLVEIVLHAAATDTRIVNAFASYSEKLGVDAQLQRRVYAGGLCFMPAEVSADQLEELAKFAFLRVARPLSRLRGTPTIERSVPAPSAIFAPLPDADALNTDLRVAVFDGGFPASSPLARWVRPVESTGVGDSVRQQQDHGHDVASALLFGSLEPGEAALTPFSNIDHYRVLDAEVEHDPFELYDVIRRIDTVLSEKKYDFINLSIGPYMSIEDDDVHPWTALLDTYLSSGQTLATIAVGNNGASDDVADRRIQVPSDCINGLSLGAADSTRAGWKRASYSATGPGRAPGFVKPDVLEFGGSNTEPFVVYGSEQSQNLAYTMGTSFAAPSALRRGIALRTHFGERLTPLGIKALLLHGADHVDGERNHVGWGRLPPSLDDIMVCEDGQVRILYQGFLTPAQYLRARIPLPTDSLDGNVTISATFTYATETDPEDPSNYSRAGLDVTFRPHDGKFKSPQAVDPTSASFFRRSDYDSESSLRQDAQKWETTLRNRVTKRGSSLQNPVFDVHYNARTHGAQPVGPRPVPYALVVGVESPRTADLYDRVVRAYSGSLEALEPVLELPLQL